MFFFFVHWEVGENSGYIDATTVSVIIDLFFEKIIVNTNNVQRIFIITLLKSDRISKLLWHFFFYSCGNKY